MIEQSRVLRIKLRFISYTETVSKMQIVIIPRRSINDALDYWQWGSCHSLKCSQLFISEKKASPGQEV